MSKDDFDLYKELDINLRTSCPIPESDPDFDFDTIRIWVTDAGVVASGTELAGRVCNCRFMVNNVRKLPATERIRTLIATWDDVKPYVLGPRIKFPNGAEYSFKRGMQIIHERLKRSEYYAESAKHQQRFKYVGPTYEKDGVIYGLKRGTGYRFSYYPLIYTQTYLQYLEYIEKTEK